MAEPVAGSVEAVGSSDWVGLRGRSRQYGTGLVHRLSLRANGRRASALMRLSGAINRLSHEIEAEQVDGPTALAVYRQLDEAVARMMDGSVNEGWASFNAARRASFSGASDEKRRALAAALQAEIQAKLAGWRKKAAAGALALSGQAVPTAEHLAAAQQHIDEDAANVYRRLDLYAKLLWFAFVALIGTVVAFFLAVDQAWLELGAESSLSTPRAVAGIVVLGVLGSLLSVALTRVRSSEERLPQMIETWLVAVLRPVLGAASAIALVIVLESGIQSAFETDGRKIYVWAILAGFSERLLRRTLISIAESAESARSNTEPKPAPSGGPD